MVLRRDLRIAFRHRAQLALPLLFFVMVVSLFPLAVSPSLDVLRTMAPGIIWVAALLATLLCLDNMFRSDFDDGTLEQLLLSPYPTSALVLAKIIAHWLVTGLPLIVVAPLLGVLTGLPGQTMGVLVASLALGTPVLSLVGAIGVALTIGLKRGGALLSLLVLPLFVPVLIFGANAVGSSQGGLEVAGQLYLLGSLLLLSLSLAPLAAAAALRVTIT